MPHASTWRALAVHTALDVFGAPGPDFATGYGIFNAQAITDLLQADFDGGASAFVKEAPLFMERAGEPLDFIEFDVVAAGGADLVCTIAWSDPTGNPATQTRNRSARGAQAITGTFADGLWGSVLGRPAGEFTQISFFLHDQFTLPCHGSAHGTDTD